MIIAKYLQRKRQGRMNLCFKYVEVSGSLSCIEPRLADQVTLTCKCRVMSSRCHMTRRRNVIERSVELRCAGTSNRVPLSPPPKQQKSKIERLIDAIIMFQILDIFVIATKN